MGRPGSDQAVKRVQRWEKDDDNLRETGRYDSAVLNIRRVSERNGKYSHVVECKLASPLKRSPVARLRRFSSENPDDADGKASALRFAFTTDSLPAFRSYLFGKSDPGDPLSNTSPVVDRSTSRLTAYVSVRRNTLLGLCFTAAICCLQNGCMRSISFRNSNSHMEAGIKRVALFLRSTSLKSWVYRLGNRTLACGGEGGVCSLNGKAPSAKCNRCGALEHPECHGQRVSGGQKAREVYVCSTCLMVEKEEIHAIRLEEQGLAGTTLEELWSEAKSVYMELKCHVCCICGCEDNEEFDDLVPCRCETSSAVVHPSCAEACKNMALKGSPRQCPICGVPGAKQGAGGGSDQCKESANQVMKVQSGSTGETRSVNFVQPVKGLKRSWNGANGSPNVDDKKNDTLQAPQSEKEGDPERTGAPLLGRRFSDVPAVVPIKKRRIHIPEVVQSPSPPPRSPSPQPLSPHLKSPSEKTSPLTQPAVALEAGQLVFSNTKSVPLDCPALPTLSPRLQSSESVEALLAAEQSVQIGSTTTTCLTEEEEAGEITQNAVVCQSLAPPLISLKGEDEPVDTAGKESLAAEDSDMAAELVSGSARRPSELSALCSLSKDAMDRPAKADELHTCNRDDRLHWDLNTDMEAWDTLTEQGAGEVGEIKESHAASGSHHILANKQTKQVNNCCNDNIEVQIVKGNSEQVTAEERFMMRSEDETGLQKSPCLLEAKSSKDNRETALQATSNKDKSDEEAIEKFEMEEQPESVDVQMHDTEFDQHAYPVTKSEGLEQLLEDPEVDDAGDCEIHEQSDHLKTSDLPEEKLERQVISLSHKVEGWERHPEESEADEHFDYGTQDQDDFQDTHIHEAQSKKHRAKADAWDQLPEEPEADEHLDYGHSYEAQGHYVSEENSAKQASFSKAKAEGWDQGPDEPEAEEHLDYGDSDCRDVDDTGLDVDERTSALLQEENNMANMEVGNLGAWDVEANSDLDADNTQAKLEEPVFDGELPESNVGRRTTTGRTRATGWDKLPEGFDSAEEALRAAKESSARRGRGGSWTSSGGRGYTSASQSSLSGSRFGSGRGLLRDGFPSTRADGYYGDRHSDELLRGRGSFSHGGRGLDDGVDANSGRNTGRRVPGIQGRGRISGWMDSQSGMGQWGPGRHRSTGFGSQGHPNAAAVAAARVESSGFVVAPDGTISKAASVIAPGRGSMRSMIGSSRGGRGPPHINAGRTPLDMDTSGNYGKRIGMGTDRGLMSSSNTNIGGRGLGSGTSMRGPMDRYRGSSYGSGGLDSRRSQSPHRSTYSLDHANFNHHAPSLRSESRVVRSKSPPGSHYSITHSKPVPSSAGRSQQSPPPSKWASDKREADNFRERDFRRPVSRSRLPSVRTSPHVVHGSNLMDDRDRQVLAGTRQSPPSRGVVSSSVYSGKSGNGGLEGRRLKRDEDEDIRHAGSHFKDGDHARISPRDGERERESRGSAYRRERGRDDDRRRDSYRLSAKDGRSTSGHKHGNSREGDDDVAPRRRRPS